MGNKQYTAERENNLGECNTIKKLNLEIFIHVNLRKIS